MSPNATEGNEPNEETQAHGHEHDEIRIAVNAQPILLARPHQTGASIKQAAISQGVPIQPDFVLSEIKPHGHQKVIPDDAQVTLKDGDEFWAIPGDDNS